MSTCSAGRCAAVAVALSVWVTVTPLVSVPRAVAVLTTEPTFTSPWVTVYVPVQVNAWPGKRVTGCVQLNAPSFGSVIVTLVSVTLPVFVASNW